MSNSTDREELLFETALALPPPERAGYLERECAGAPALRQRIEHLLRAHAAAGEFLEMPVEPPPPLPAVPVSLPLAETPGLWIGRYKLLEKIGEGGCGVVFLAEQEEPVRRRVALKIVKLGMDTRQVIARFEAERQALAMMDHPNIARVFDAGATDTGRPYFVMELVRGVRITEFCDEHTSSTAERLNLFVQVCHAIQHAHHKGVIHRDIKPSNILITLHDGVPIPKVIDFGIAKATQGRLTERTLFTAFEQFVGTPAYMSPEQAEMSELDVDTRSDIYSLGVLLYELLTGRPPFAADDLLRSGVIEMRRRIRESEPPRPSTQLDQLDPATLTATAQRRRTAAPDLIRALRGDLDWIVMRCLEKDRLRRYQTAIGLGNDVRRHLNHEPVEARPPGVVYVFRKFARRHRVAFLASAAVLAVLVGTSAISLRLALVARRAEARAASEAAAAKQVIDFLQNDLLAPAQPDQAPVWDLKLRTVLDRANQSLEGRMSSQPLVEASLRETIAATYKSLGEYATERQHLEKALAIYQRHNGPAAAATLNLSHQLADALWHEGRYADAEKLARATREAQERTRGPDHADTLRSMHLLASILWDQGRLRESLDLHQETMNARVRVLGREHPDTLNSMQDLAQAFRGYGRYLDAATLGRRTMEAKRRILGPEHASTLSAINSLAMTFRAQGQFADAETLHRNVLEIRRRTLGPDHPATLISMTNLVTVFQDQGRFAEAERGGTQTLNAKRRTLGPEHPSTLNSMSILAQLQQAQGRTVEAATLHTNVLEIRRRTLGPQHPDTLLSMHYLADNHLERGDLPAAAALFTRTLELRRQTLGSEHPATAQTLEDLGRVLLRQEKSAEAEPLLREALAARERQPFPTWRTGATRSLLGEALTSLGRFEAAERQHVIAVRLLSRPPDAIPAGSRSVVRESGERLVRLYSAWGRPDEARQWEAKLAQMAP